MMRTAILTIAAILAAALPSAAQDVAAEPARTAKQSVKAQAEAAKDAKDATRKVTRDIQRAQRVERIQRVDKREDQRAQQTETVTRTVKLGAQGEIDLQNMSGSVTVTRGGGNEVTINAVKTARAATEAEAKEMLGVAKVDIAERAGRVEVRTHYMHVEPAPPPPPPPPPGGRDVPRPPRPNRRGINVSVAYTITAPAGTTLRINTMSGDITVSDITGELVLEAMSGNVKVERAARVLTARAMSGDVSLADVKSDGAIAASSMSGDVTLRQVKARRIDAAVVSGTVSLADVECERLEGQTTSGSVVYEGPLVKGGRYEFQSHSGDVKVMLSGNTGFQLDANSWGGNVRSDLELKNVEQGPPDNIRQTRAGVGPRNRTLRGTFGDGSAVLEITTFSGTIVVSRRVAEKR
jgi:DUF4097 and DUF4098 domain-containing protein YvlB